MGLSGSGINEENHMRAGRLDEASACTRRGGVEIERRTKRHLCDIDPRNGLGDLWRRVGEVTGGSDDVTVMTTGSVLTNSMNITPAYRQMRGMSRPVSRLLYTLERTLYPRAAYFTC